jgi:hypothetical protein
MQSAKLRKVLAIASVFAVLYVLACGALFAAMKQPPEKFSAFMAKMPRPFMYVLPFPPLWSIARGGRLHVGDAAPDFSLNTVNHDSRVVLSSFRGQKPVVLVFGSYT